MHRRYREFLTGTAPVFCTHGTPATERCPECEAEEAEERDHARETGRQGGRPPARITARQAAEAVAAYLEPPSKRSKSEAVKHVAKDYKVSESTVWDRLKRAEGRR